MLYRSPSVRRRVASAARTHARSLAQAAASPGLATGTSSAVARRRSHGRLAQWNSVRAAGDLRQLPGGGGAQHCGLDPARQSERRILEDLWARCGYSDADPRNRVCEPRWRTSVQRIAKTSRAKAQPNMRLKLAGADRSKGSGVFVPWRARTVVHQSCAGERVARSLSAIR